MTKTLLKYKHESMDLKRGSCIVNYKGVNLSGLCVIVVAV